MTLYYGAVRTGKTIEPPAPAGTFRFSADYPGFNSSTASAGNLIRIVLHLHEC